MGDLTEEPSHTLLVFPSNTAEIFSLAASLVATTRRISNAQNGAKAAKARRIGAQGRPFLH